MSILQMNASLLQMQHKRRVYGYLYNFYALSGIANQGWRIPTNNDWESLIALCGGRPIAAKKIKGTRSALGVGLDPYIDPCWQASNSAPEVSNEFLLSIYGAGMANYSHVFSSLRQYGRYWSGSKTSQGAPYRITFGRSDNDTPIFYDTYRSRSYGYSIRLCRDASPDEVSTIPERLLVRGYYGGNDGKKYTCVRISSLIWTAENLAETKYNDGSDIPYVTDSAQWSVLTTGARCAYNNDMSYV